MCSYHLQKCQLLCPCHPIRSCVSHSPLHVAFMHTVGRSKEHFEPRGFFSPSPRLMMPIPQSWPVLDRWPWVCTSVVPEAGIGHSGAECWELNPAGSSSGFLPRALYPNMTQATLNHLKLLVSALVLVCISNVLTVVTASDDVGK